MQQILLVLIKWSSLGQNSFLILTPWAKKKFYNKETKFNTETRGCIFSHVQPVYEQAVSNLDRSMNRLQWVLAAHGSFIEGSHTTKNTASGFGIELFSLL